MNPSSADAATRAALYADQRGLTIEKPLGGGWDGIVLCSSRKTAIKSLNRLELYETEKAVYLRLREHAIRQIGRFQIPDFIDCHDGLLVIEMSIVSPPFVLDFAGARLDHPTEYDADILAEWQAEKREQFEADWPEVRLMIYSLQRYGVYLSDVHPGNVQCH